MSQPAKKMGVIDLYKRDLPALGLDDTFSAREVKQLIVMSVVGGLVVGLLAGLALG